VVTHLVWEQEVEVRRGACVIWRIQSALKVPRIGVGDAIEKKACHKVTGFCAFWAGRRSRSSIDVSPYAVLISSVVEFAETPKFEK